MSDDDGRRPANEPKPPTPAQRRRAQPREAEAATPMPLTQAEIDLLASCVVPALRARLAAEQPDDAPTEEATR